MLIAFDSLVCILKIETDIFTPYHIYKNHKMGREIESGDDVLGINFKRQDWISLRLEWTTAPACIPVQSLYANLHCFQPYNLMGVIVIFCPKLLVQLFTNRN